MSFVERLSWDGGREGVHCSGPIVANACGLNALFPMDTRTPIRNNNEFMDSFPLRPREVFEALSKTVVGQDEAIRELSVAIVKHLVGHPAPNMLLIGNSGSGKTTLMRAVEQFLASRPELSHSANVIRINANVLAEEHQGYGRSEEHTSELQ